MAVRTIVRPAFIHRLVETRGWTFVNALAASGFLEWLESREDTVTGTAITAQLRERLPSAVVRGAAAHLARRAAEGAGHRCADCAFR